MKKVSKIIIVLICLVLILVIIFALHSPDGVEDRVKKVCNIIYSQDESTANELLDEYFSDYNEKEKIEIFRNLPFKVIKDNREWLVSVMDDNISSWKNDNCFNSKYLLTEAELIEKRNLSVIRNIEVMNKKIEFSDLHSISDEIYECAKINWQIKKGNFFVIDETLSANFSISKNNSKYNYNVEKFSVDLFEIETGYVFHIKYEGGNLQIVPTLYKIEDNGAFELKENLGFYECARILDYECEKRKTNYTGANCIISDKIANFEPSDNNLSTLKNIIYNKEKISELDNFSESIYVGTIYYFFTDINKSNDNIQVGNEVRSDNLNQNTKSDYVYINLFKRE